MQKRNDVLDAALRALSDWTEGRYPTPTDAELIYRDRSGSTHTPFDELCCQVIQDYLKDVSKAQSS